MEIAPPQGKAITSARRITRHLLPVGQGDGALIPPSVVGRHAQPAHDQDGHAEGQPRITDSTMRRGRQASPGQAALR